MLSCMGTFRELQKKGIDEPQPKPLIPDWATPAASISWIAAVIIAIVVIIAIGALTACIVMRTRGETYMLDREERALGNDPEKELREKEAFRTYERA
ncbi:unnamed protein product [Echinostoma caproni]|uniref:Glycophorin-A n=1 Tax=Echinostoma caproni TaxID=27848 RepID=A0A183B883_9TREM|nr:unnamed protein product [Echinostoma caproni]